MYTRGESRQRLIHSPCLWLVLVLFLVTLRWVCVATTGDFGVAYEPAWRIAHGEQQYADFYLTLPPLTNYTLAGFILVFGESLWAWVIHLYAWWFAASVAGLLLLLRLDLPRALIPPTLFLAAVFSSPPVMDGNCYDYASTFVAGMMILAMLPVSNVLSGRRVVWIGVLSGICVLTKQNVGAVMTVAAVVGTGWYAVDHGGKRVLSHACLFTGGFALGFLPSILWFAAHAGFSEVWLQMFQDASAGKGGPIQIIVRAMPRIIFSYGTFANKRIFELVASVSLFVAMVVWLWRSTGGEDGATGSRRGDATEPNVLRLTMLSLLLAVLYGVTLIEAPSVAEGLRQISRTILVNPYFLFVEIVYLLLVATAAVTLGLWGRRWWRSENAWSRVDIQGIVAWLAGLLAFSHSMTSPAQMIVSAPVVLPCLVYLLYQRLGNERTLRLCWHGAFSTVLLATLFCPRSAVFEHLVPFPRSGAFAGLHGHPDVVRAVSRMEQQVAPRIQGRSTLWLTALGPHSAYGGLPVRNVAVFYSDTYHPRIEDRLFAHWEASPPEYVVCGDFLFARGTKRLLPDSLPEWLSQRYRRVYEFDDSANEFGRYHKLSVWKRTAGGREFASR